MTHFLYKPHVAGPEDSITTPDIVIDRVSILADGDRHYLPVHRLNSDIELQVLPGDIEVTPAYAFVASGGGALVSLAALVRQSGDPLAKADLLIARHAWRLRNVVDHFAALAMSVSGGTGSASVTLADETQPADVMTASSNAELVLPRGITVLCAIPAATVTTAAPAETTVQLTDDKRNRSLSHTTDFVSVDVDRWTERPLPRYTVGPVGDVQHYI